jgi:hypothetical protein
MKVTRIEIKGRTGTAAISRESENKVECIFCEIRNPAGQRVAIHHVDVNDRDDQFSMAQGLQHQLDGYSGTNSEIHEYFSILEMMAD